MAGMCPCWGLAAKNINSPESMQIANFLEYNCAILRFEQKVGSLKFRIIKNRLKHKTMLALAL